MNAPARAPAETLPFADAVAARCDRDATFVDEVLAKHAVVASPSPPPARPLRVRSIAFSGVKTLHGSLTPFRFAWNVDQGGLFGIVTEDNLVGKTSILQIVLWALRGAPKNLSTAVASWVRAVDVTFLADRREVNVAFALADGEPHGIVTVRAGGGEQVRQFGDEAQFRRVMQEVMLEALALEPIPATRTSADGRTVAYDDGWAAYTGAFLADADSNAIIGEHVGNDLTQRLLQVFVGLPWARTLFQARSRLNVLESDGHQRKRKLTSLGGRSVSELEGELRDVVRRITDEAARNHAAQELLEVQNGYDSLSREVRLLRQRLDLATEQLEEAKQARLNAERGLLMVREERAAAAFFGRLSPQCCPRCSSEIDASRRRAEAVERRCSVCSETAPLPDEPSVAAEIALAETRFAEVRGLETDAGKVVRDAERRFATKRGQLVALGDRLQALSASGTAADLQVLERRRERLEGMLEVATAVLDADLADSDEMAVLEAASKEASERVSSAADAVLARASAEVTRIVQRLGMRDVEKVDLKRNAHVRIHKGGTVAHWGGISAGEQLRLRIATVIALVRSAREHQAGRHPGLLMIDSPANEEMADSNLADMIEELGALANESDGLQMFIALRGPTSTLGALASDRRRVAPAGEYLW